MRRARELYGADLWQLALVLLCFSLVGYVVGQVLGDPAAWVIGAWFLGAVIGHDLLLFPVYALADVILAHTVRRWHHPHRWLPIPVVNYVRLPALASGLTLILFLPGIIQQGAQTYLNATGQTQQPYLRRWLIFVLVAFAVSGCVYAIRVWFATRPLRHSQKLARSVVEPGERVLTFAAVPGAAPEAVGGSGGLYFPVAEEKWRRIGWEDLRSARWQADRGELVVQDYAERTTLSLAAPRNLPDLVTAEITASHLATERVGQHVQLRVARNAHTGRVAWQVRLDAPTSAETVDQAIHELSQNLGIPAGPWHEVGV
ncbi:hypothetical protein [Fodinicola feengrottensis]|uniref:Uncharacterized protein n=1 Tax=Fodinicola feengrottensis TaxID=435914 RepID=A0ABN2INQ6_9ACTN